MWLQRVGRAIFLESLIAPEHIGKPTIQTPHLCSPARANTDTFPNNPFPSTSFLKNDSKLFAGCVRTLFDHCFVYWVALTPIIQSATDSSVPTGDHAPSSRESDRPGTNLIPYPPAVGQQVDQIPLGHADLLAAKQLNTSRAWVSSQLTVVPVVLVQEAAFRCSSQLDRPK